MMSRIESNVVWNDLLSTEISISVVCVENDDVDKSTVWAVESEQAEFGGYHALMVRDHISVICRNE
jgi:hypothetical protein